jgi:hypothetical protein
MALESSVIDPSSTLSAPQAERARSERMTMPWRALKSM